MNKITSPIKNYFKVNKLIYDLLEKSVLKYFVLVIILLLLNTFLEILTLSLLLPILTTFMETQNIVSSFIISLMPEKFLILNDNNKIQILLLIFVGFFLLKNVVYVYLTYIKYFLIFRILGSTSKNLYLSYIRKPYYFFLNFNSSLAMRNFQTEIPEFTRLIFSIINLIQEIALTVAIFLFLFIVNAKVTLIVFISISFISIFYLLLIKPILEKWAKSRQFYTNLKIKNILESFQSIKEIKIFNKELNSVDLFNYNNEKAITNTRKERTLGQMPRVFFEILILIVLVFAFSILLKDGYSTNKIVTILGIYFFSAMRILPSINRIISSFQDYSTTYPAAEIIFKETLKLDQIKSETNISKFDDRKLNFDNEINIENISFKYTNTNRYILQNLNLKIKKNSIIGIFGKTGNGKSTLINIITGLLSPNNGSIYCDNFDITKNKRAWQNLIGYVAQNVYLSDDTIENNIKFENFTREKETTEKLVNKKELNNDLLMKVSIDAGLTEFLDKLDKGFKSTTGESSLKISGGQKQRIGIARALYRNPQILLLDEATSSLDSNTEKEILTRLENLKDKITIIIISHKKDNFRMCDEVYELKEGKLFNNNIEKNSKVSL